MKLGRINGKVWMREDKINFPNSCNGDGIVLRFNRTGVAIADMHIPISRSMLIASLVLTVGVLTTASLAAPATQPTTTKKPEPPRTAAGAVTPVEKNPERHKQFLKRAAEGNVDLLFLGDSITDVWPKRGPNSWKKYEAWHPANFGISGDRTEHLLWRITNGELDNIHPRVVVIMIGTNNVGHFEDETPEWAAAGVEKIVQTVREKLPQSKILLLGVFPRDKEASELRARVAAVHQIISKLDDGKMRHYLDIGDRFLDKDGEISPDIMPDKLHPSAKGYDIWYEAMQPTLERLMKE